MRKQINPNMGAHLLQRTFYLLLLVAFCVIPFALAERNATKPRAPTALSQRTLTFAERVAYQRVIEDIYWRHRIWPKERPDLKPSLDAVMSQAQLEKKVEDYLRKSQALEDYWQRPITAEQLQAEMERMVQYTKQPEVLHELFAALGNDSFIVAECLARPAIAERLLANFVAQDQRLYSELTRGGQFGRTRTGNQMPMLMAAANATYRLPTILDRLNGCINNWVATSTTNAPSARASHTAVWTGSEMIVWGGNDGTNVLSTGGEYNPATDSWTATSTTNAPSARAGHTAVWTGNEMIVWGGAVDNTGGRYNPSTDIWTATSTTDAPTFRGGHTAVWTGSEMIVWGGEHGFPVIFFNTGGRYNPATDSWTATSTTNAPSARAGHTAVWTDGEMIVWGGLFVGGVAQRLNTGGRYDPNTDIWVATSTTNAPSARDSHTAVWSGAEMIVWGGSGASGGTFGPLSTGGRYDPGTDSWTVTNIPTAPSARAEHTAVWTGSEMIVWGGDDGPGNYFNTGGRYCAPCMGRCEPTPRPRPTPAPRP